jgi:hypothetical protein
LYYLYINVWESKTQPKAELLNVESLNKGNKRQYIFSKGVNIC